MENSSKEGFMSKQEERRPSIRFKGYTEPWEQRKFKDLSSKRGKRNSSGNEYPVYSVSNQSGLIPQSEQFEGSRLDTLDKNSYKIVEPNDFAYNPARINVGSIAFNHLSESVIVSSLYVIFSLNRSVDNRFALQFIKSDDFIKEVRKNTEGSVREYLFYENFSNIRLPLPPTLPEQTAIGSFFQELDQLITLQQRELELMKEGKKALLSKMFPKDGENFPEIRFPGFTDAWEQRKLGEIAERVTRKNKNLESELPLTISAQHGLINQETFFNKKVASKDVSGYYLLKKGEFAYNKSYSSDYPWGAVKRLDNYEMGVLSTLYIVFRPNSIDSDFLAVYYDSPKWHKEVSMRAAEGARNHGLLNISPQDFFDTELIFPVNHPEQAAIGSFFQELDQLITLQQRELEILKIMKSTLLKAMFA